MSALVETPQCLLCYESLKKSTELVRPSGCGHVLCKGCSESMRKSAYKCPFHCTSSSGETYEPVYLDFGVHSVGTPDEAAEIGNDKKSNLDIDASVVDIHPVETVTIARLLGEVARSRPENWCTANANGYQKGLVFLRASRQLHKISDGVQGNDAAKGFLLHLADAVSDLKELYDSMADRIRGNESVRDKLEQMNSSLRSERDRTKETLKEKVAWYEKKLASERKVHSERESQLRGDLTTVHTKWKEERIRRITAEDSVKQLREELKRWMSNSAKYLKKYEREKAKNIALRQGVEGTGSAGRPRQNGWVSDDSLEIESRQSEIEAIRLDDQDKVDTTSPLSSASPTTNSNVAPETFEPGSSHNASHQLPDPPSLSWPSSSKPSANPFRRKEKVLSDGTLSFNSTDSGAGLVKASFKPSHRISRPRSSSPPSMPRLNPKVKTKDKKQSQPPEPIVDRELLEICPDLANELDVPDHSNAKEADKRKPRSTRGLKVSIPTNPLATRQNTESLRGPERKKQRLTLGVAGD